RADRALSEFAVEGADTNIGLLHAALALPEVAAAQFHTQLVNEKLPALLAAAAAWRPDHIAANAGAARQPSAVSAPPGTVAVRAPMQGKIVSLEVSVGDLVAGDATVAVIEAMKMEHI